MKTKVPAVVTGTVVGDVERMLKDSTSTFDSINYIYIVKEGGELSGVVPIKALFDASPDTVVDDLSPKEVVHVHAKTDQERVAFLALKYNIKVVPVVDSHGRLLGIVSTRDILLIIDTEAVEDFLRLGGVVHEAGPHGNVLTLPITVSLRRRLPWLIVGLIGGIMTAGVIGFFEDILATYVVLAAFIPLIVYVADAVGTQMATFIVRDLAFTSHLRFLTYFFRQFLVVSVIGLVLASLLFVITFLLYGDPMVSFVLALSLIAACLSALFSGLVVPYLFSKLRFDPADASGPIATIIQDVLSVLIYLTVALSLLS